MAFEILTSSPNSAEHRSFITVYKPIAGWKAVQYWWNEDPEIGGFWEPWQTGICAFATKEEATEDAKFWAEDEELPLYLSPTNTN